MFAYTMTQTRHGAFNLGRKHGGHPAESHSILCLTRKGGGQASDSNSILHALFANIPSCGNRIWEFLVCFTIASSLGGDSADHSPFRISGSPNFRISGYSPIRISGIPDTRNFWKSGFPKIRISGIPKIRKSGIP